MAPLPDAGPAPDFTGIANWINSPALKLADLRGKVVLVDFWTYSCINCIRTLPYVTAWYDKYKDQGLVMVGVHTPEFAFEHETANVQDAARRYHIAYPVAQDNNYATWNAYTTFTGRRNTSSTPEGTCATRISARATMTRRSR